MSGKRHTVLPRVLSFVFNKDFVLMIKASNRKDWFGYYQPPGGHIEYSEDVISCAEKEIYEETGLKVDSTKLADVVHVGGFYGNNIMLFMTKSTTSKTKIKPSDEGVPVWIKLEDLNKINLLEDVKLMIKKILLLKKGEIFIGTSEFDGKDKLNSFDVRVT